MPAIAATALYRKGIYNYRLLNCMRLFAWPQIQNTFAVQILIIQSHDC